MTERELMDRQVADARACEQRVAELEAALRNIIEIGKRDMTNEKYDVYFDYARALLARGR